MKLLLDFTPGDWRAMLTYVFVYDRPKAALSRPRPQTMLGPARRHVMSTKPTAHPQRKKAA